jgi:hypothetical protein
LAASWGMTEVIIEADSANLIKSVNTWSLTWHLKV